MLTSFYFRQTSRHLIFISSRVTLSTLPYPKSSETQAASDGTPINYPSNIRRDYNTEPVPPNERSEKIVSDAKVSNTFVLPGIPVNPSVPPLASEQQRTKKEEEHERIPSSRFSAFLRSIQSGLPFFPSKKNLASTIDISTTREHFIPVHISFFYFKSKSTIFLVNTSFINTFISN
jgi:hypothetical protein